MKAVMQNFRNGKLSVSEVPPPIVRPGSVLVHNVASLVSTGTEKAIIELAKMNLLQKSRTRPDLVRKVLNRAKQEGLLGTIQTVTNLVSVSMPLGYSCAGIVDVVGAGVTDFITGDRIACAGYGYANHAEMALVPRNLAVHVPPEVSFEEAAFVTLGAIAMQGMRQAELVVGESVVVLGLGLLGQLTTQICAAAGCHVFGIDLDAAKVALAQELGTHAGQTLDDGDVVAAVQQFTRNRGADAIIITAATPSSQPVELAAELARDRARVVAVGDIGLDIPRRAFYEKELDLRLSRSYGPGRYDVFYEEKGHDYPIGYVRWTENRNMEAFLDLIAQRKIRVSPLITHRFPIERAEQAYELLTGKRQECYIGILLQYDADSPQPSTVVLRQPKPSRPSDGKADKVNKHPVRIGVIGAGQFAQGVLLPRLRKIDGVEISAIATGSGYTARTVAEKYGCQFCTSDYREILAQPDIDAVLIATRHNLHSRLVIDALAVGKHVFVEKPLAITKEELDAIIEAYDAANKRAKQKRRTTAPIVMVGFNRRYSPSGLAAKQLLTGLKRPAVIDYRVNAGAVPANSWVHDPAVGGGRLVGEMCHSIDFVQFVIGKPVVEVTARASDTPVPETADPDTVVALLRFADGSVATVRYLANGEQTIPKERVEIFCSGHVLTIDNYRSYKLVGPQRTQRWRMWFRTAKGRRQELEDFVYAIQGEPLRFGFQTAVESTRIIFAIQESLCTGRTLRF